ncbi:hypothetical protein YW3DRAFT_07167 [Streptomyces sp. MnatMP-M77]|nr:hypothetical protein YW3DRAFT_07167 [Streptomyces sp. MnatMP-M77]
MSASWGWGVEAMGGGLLNGRQAAWAMTKRCDGELL